MSDFLKRYEVGEAFRAELTKIAQWAEDNEPKIPSWEAESSPNGPLSDEWQEYIKRCAGLVEEAVRKLVCDFGDGALDSLSKNEQRLANTAARIVASETVTLDDEERLNIWEYREPSAEMKDLQNTLKFACYELAEELGRFPTFDEVMRHMGRQRWAALKKSLLTARDE